MNRTDLKVVRNPGQDVWDEVYNWILQEKWAAFHPEMWNFIKNYPGIKLIAAVMKEECLDTTTKNPLCALIYLKPEGMPVKNVMVYITHPQHRGQGIGTFLWKQMESDRPELPMQIYSVKHMTEVYRVKYGFEFINPMGAMAWKIRIQKLLQLAESQIVNKNETQMESYETTKHLEKVVQYDSGVAGRNRKDTLPPYLEMKCATSVVALDSRSFNLVGFGCLTNAENGLFLNPIYSEDPVTAFKIITELLKSVRNKHESNQFVQIRIPERNEDFLKMIKEIHEEGDYELRYVESFTQPYQSKVDWNRVYSRISFQPDC